MTPKMLSHRREPPHTKFNADIAFDDVASAVELNLEGGSKWFRMLLKNGQSLELPANTVMTAARDTIAGQLRDHGISVTTQTIRRGSR